MPPCCDLGTVAFTSDDATRQPAGTSELKTPRRQETSPCDMCRAEASFLRRRRLRRLSSRHLLHCIVTNAQLKTNTSAVVPIATLESPR